MDESLLIVGLGNPGLDYRNTRHNIGFMILDELAVKLNARFTRLQSKALVATVFLATKKVILAKPQTYMNSSGQSVRELVRFYKLELSDIIVIHDDLYLPVGDIRIRPDGGSGGHQGMNSIIEKIGTDDFPRLKIGIGSPPGQMRAEDYVLENFSDNEFPLMRETSLQVVGAILLWIDGGIHAAMNKYNGKFSTDI